MKMMIMALLVFGFSVQVLADDCKKLVFNKYCLGGDLSKLEKEYKPDRKRVMSDKTMFAYASNKEIVVVLGFNKKVMSVSKIYTPGTWLNYSNIKSRLVKFHGDGENLDYFPEYADSKMSQSTAITLGEGQAKQYWDKKGWKIVLLWSGKKSISLFYIDKKLDKEYKSSNSEGL